MKCNHEGSRNREGAAMKTCGQCKWYDLWWPEKKPPYGKCQWAVKNLPSWMWVHGVYGAIPGNFQAEICPCFEPREATP